MQLVVLAAGRGERLRPLTDTVPKPIVPVAGYPLLHHVLKAVQPKWIVDELVVCTGWLGEQVEEYVTDWWGKSGKSKWGKTVKFSRGGPRGPGQDLLAARELLQDRFIVLNADTVVHTDYDLMRSFHSFHSGLITMGVKRGYATNEGNVGTQNDGLVRSFRCDTLNRNLPWLTVRDSVDAGVAIWEKKALNYIDQYKILRYGQLVQDGLVYWYPVKSFVDFGTAAEIEEYERAYS
jgi:NDP-sugar pyrophosphorylase family protein